MACFGEGYASFGEASFSLLINPESVSSSFLSAHSLKADPPLFDHTSVDLSQVLTALERPLSFILLETLFFSLTSILRALHVEVENICVCMCVCTHLCALWQ